MMRDISISLLEIAEIAMKIHKVFTEMVVKFIAFTRMEGFLKITRSLESMGHVRRSGATVTEIRRE